MSLINDDTVYRKLSEELVIRHVDLMARILHSNPNVPFDLFELTKDADILLFDICFFSISTFEEQSGFEVDGNRFLPKPAFTTPDSHDKKVVIGDTILHGLADDPYIALGLERAKSKVDEKPKIAL